MSGVGDIFAISSTGYLRPPSPGCNNPGGPPSPPVAQELMEAPYFMTSPGVARQVLAMAARGDFMSTIFTVLSSGVDVAEEQPFTPYGVLQAAYPARTPMDDATGFWCACAPQVD